MTDPTIEPLPASVRAPVEAPVESTVEEIAPAPIAGDADMVETAEVIPSRRRPRLPSLSLRRTAGGIAAVGVKELRGRMRGRRAFVILTIYLLLLGGFAWMVELLMERSYSTGFGSSAAFASAEYIETGIITRPKEMFPFHMGRGIKPPIGVRRHLRRSVRRRGEERVIGC